MSIDTPVTGEFHGWGARFERFHENPRVFIVDNPESSKERVHRVPMLRGRYEAGIGATLILDERLALDLPDDPKLIESVVRFVADALAIGAGHPSFARTDLTLPFRD